MVKVTDTRERVRECARLILEKGGTPTPTLIRKMLGGKGSFSTIIDELDKFATEQGVGLDSAPRSTNVQQAVEHLALDELASMLSEARTTTLQMQSLLSSFQVSLSEIVTETRSISDLRNVCEELGRALSLDKADLTKELTGMIERFDGMQRHMLLEIESAREDARKWKASFLKARDEGESWKISMTMRFNKQQEEIAYLRGRLDERTDPDLPLHL